MSSSNVDKSTTQAAIIGWDPVAIRDVVEALRARDFNKCREPQILHVCRVLEKISRLKERLDGDIDVFLDALADISNGAVDATPPMALAQSFANHLGFGRIWRDGVQARTTASRKPKEYVRIVDELVKRRVCSSQAEASRLVADWMGIKEGSVKRAIQRGNKSR